MQDSLQSRRIIEEFESTWTRNSASSIQELVSCVPDDDQQELFAELLAVDIRNRVIDGGEARAEEYLRKSFELDRYQPDVVYQLGKMGVIIQVPRKQTPPSTSQDQGRQADSAPDATSTPVRPGRIP